MSNKSSCLAIGVAQSHQTPPTQPKSKATSNNIAIASQKKNRKTNDCPLAWKNKRLTKQSKSLRRNYWHGHLACVGVRWWLGWCIEWSATCSTLSLPARLFEYRSPYLGKWGMHGRLAIERWHCPKFTLRRLKWRKCQSKSCERKNWPCYTWKLNKPIGGDHNPRLDGHAIILSNSSLDIAGPCEY